MKKKKKVLVSKLENWACLRYFMLVFGIRDDWFMGLGTVCADSSECPAFTSQAWISSTINRLKRKRWVSKQERFPACYHLPPVSHGLFKQPAFSSPREVRVSLLCHQAYGDVRSCLQAPTSTLSLRREACMPSWMRLLLEESWGCKYCGCPTVS